MRALASAIDGMELPAIEKISETQQEDPFQVLIGTLLSARTQDATTLAASTRLFKVARTPRTMAKLTVKQIEKLIYPVSFYRNKARHREGDLRGAGRAVRRTVPGTLEELVTLPGVGRKTANLVMILAFQSPRNICVDTHVHRISNRLGWVRTREPEETEQALYRAHRSTVVALHQPVPGDLGTERLPAGVPAVWRLRARSGLPAHRALPMVGKSTESETEHVRCRTCPGVPAIVCLPCCMAWRFRPQPRRRPSPGAGPVVVFETEKGTFEFETYPNEAPKTVAHIVGLVKKRFYNGHARASRRARLRRPVGRSADPGHDEEGAAGARGGSGTPIGVAEISKTRTHGSGAVAMAHAGDAAQGRQPVLRDACAAAAISTAATRSSAR